MGYEINVAKNGTHYFATNERSIGYSKIKCKEIYDNLKKVFPESEGYSITVTLYHNTGTTIDMDKL